MTPEQERLSAILTPEAHSRLKSVEQADGVRFVHYTTAEVAVSIIKNRGIWMRNAFVMNDYSEVRYGMDCFPSARHGAFGFGTPRGA